MTQFDLTIFSPLFSLARTQTHCSVRHFTIRGADDTDFAGGIYHGRILLPPEYPFKPPHIVMLTPSGRFETNTKVCLSFSAFHPELWQPAWGIRLILEALISFLPTPADGAIGAVDWSPAERKKLARQSVHFECPICGKVANLLPQKSAKTASGKATSKYQKEIEELQRLQIQENTSNDDNKGDDNSSKARRETARAAVDEAAAAAPNEKPGPVNEKESVRSQKTESSPAVIDEVETPIARTDRQAKSPEQAREEKTGEELDRQGEDVADIPEETSPEPPQAVQETPAAQDHAVAPPETLIDPLMDPILQGIILILSAICYLLARKVQDLIHDVQDLQAANP